MDRTISCIFWMLHSTFTDQIPRSQYSNCRRSQPLSNLQVIGLALSCSVLAAEQGECDSNGLYDGEFFKGIGRIPYEGPDSKNPLAFHYYNADEEIMGKPMKDWYDHFLFSSHPSAWLFFNPQCYIYQCKYSSPSTCTNHKGPIRAALQNR